MGELYDRLVEPYLADFEKDWVDKVDPLEIKKVIEEMERKMNINLLKEAYTISNDKEVKNLIKVFIERFYEWVGGDKKL